MTKHITLITHCTRGMYDSSKSNKNDDTKLYQYHTDQVCEQHSHQNFIHKKKKKSSQCRDGSMNALSNKVHYKQEVPHSDVHSITWPHQSTTIHIEVAVAHLGTIYCYLCRNMVVEQCGVHVTVCMARLVYVLCVNHVHSLNHPYISWISFRNLFMEACFCSFRIKNFLFLPF